jgi:hypothetical protein
MTVLVVDYCLRFGSTAAAAAGKSPLTRRSDAARASWRPLGPSLYLSSRERPDVRRHPRLRSLAAATPSGSRSFRSPDPEARAPAYAVAPSRSTIPPPPNNPRHSRAPLSRATMVVYSGECCSTCRPELS